MKKALIFNPYFNTLGGGEYYTISVANFLIKNGFKVEIAWKETDLLKKIYYRFNLNLENKVQITNLAYNIFSKKSSLFDKFKLTSKFDIIFYVSDGSIPFLFSKNNFIHFQVPFRNVNGRNFLNQIKLKNIKIICNSFFTKSFIDNEFNAKSKVIYPPLLSKFPIFKKTKKENIILSVGRFDQIMHAKKQDKLVIAYKQMVDKGLKNWQLVLLGGLMKENSYFEKLKGLSKGYPVKIITNVDFKTLVNYYQKAKIYWHAAGFEEDLRCNPEKAEHFGISVVEAMASKCVPLVFNGGGLPEIVDNQINGYLWKTISELKTLTKKLIGKRIKLNKLAKNAYLKSQKFSQKIFEENLKRTLF